MKVDPPPLRIAPPVGQTALAWRDLNDSLGLSWFWLALGWNDVRQRYRGSLLGPLWLTITTGILIVGLGPLYAQLFGLDLAAYMPFMALGVTTWSFITATILDSCSAFVGSAHLMKQMRLPRLFLLFQVLWRSVVVFAHSLPIYAVVFLWFGLPIGPRTLLVIPGFAILCLNLFWIGLIAALLCARYRDVIPIVGSVLQIGFFFTPVLWSHTLQNVNPIIVNLNPLAAFVELIRAPLMNQSFSPPLLLLALACLPIGYGVAIAFFIRYRRRIAYWV